MKKLLYFLFVFFMVLSQTHADEVTFYIPDAQGSPVAAMDETGAILWRKHYQPFGGELDAQATNNRIGYTGHVKDDTGLNYMGARYYDPSIGRFLSMDPAAINPNDPRTFNRYSYANNSPYRFVDPDGRELVDVELSGIGKTYLDDAFSPKAEDFIKNAKTAGVDLEFNSAYRSPEKQAELKKDETAITPADTSLHSAGFAVDVNFSSLADIADGLTGDQQREVIKSAAKDAGLDWGGHFKSADPPHFYSDPGNREEKVTEAAKKYSELTK